VGFMAKPSPPCAAGSRRAIRRDRIVFDMGLAQQGLGLAAKNLDRVPVLPVRLCKESGDSPQFVLEPFERPNVTITRGGLGQAENGRDFAVVEFLEMS